MVLHLAFFVDDAKYVPVVDKFLQHPKFKIILLTSGQYSTIYNHYDKSIFRNQLHVLINENITEKTLFEHPPHDFVIFSPFSHMFSPDFLFIPLNQTYQVTWTSKENIAQFVFSYLIAVRWIKAYSLNHGKCIITRECSKEDVMSVIYTHIFAHFNKFFLFP